MAQHSNENFNSCFSGLQTLLSTILPSLQHVIDMWHHQTKQNIQPCTNPAQCPPKKKPSAKNKSCQECIDWTAAIEAEVYPPSAVGSLQWTNVNPALFSSNLLEFIKLFVLRIQGNQAYSLLADFDHASILMIMGKFKPFHQGDQGVFDAIQKVAPIRNCLAHFKLSNNLHLNDTTFNDFWTDINDLVDKLQGLGRTYFTKQTADELREKLHEIATPQVNMVKNVRSIATDVFVELHRDGDQRTGVHELLPTPRAIKTLTESMTSMKLHAETANFESDASINQRSEVRIPAPILSNTDELLIQTITEDLKEYYLNSYCKEKMYPWKPGNFVDLDSIYVPVTIDITIPGMRPIKERLKSYLDIFQNQTDTRHLLSGSPGQGKSTFCSKLAFDWCNKTDDSPMQDVELLFIVQLSRVNHQSTIEDVISSQLLSPDIESSAPMEILRKLGKKVVLFFYGLDEAPPDLFKRKDFGNLLEIIQYKHLRQCRVLLTTRPWRESEITARFPVYRRLELQKMKRSDVIAHVQKVFETNPDDVRTVMLGKSLIQFIKENRLLVDVTSPLMVLLISWYWNQTNGEKGIPERSSELYEEIFNILCQQTSDCSFSKEVFIEQFGELCFQELTPTTTKIVFTEDEIKQVCGEGRVDQALAMGILCRKGEQSLQCYHKTGQEFIEGKFLQNNQKRLKQYLQGVKSMKDAFSIAPVLVFASTSRLAAKLILTKLTEIFRSVSQIEAFYREDLAFDEILPIQKFIELCLECNFEADAKAYFIPWLKHILVRGKVLLYGISSKIATLLGYFMRYSGPDVIRAIDLRPIAHVSHAGLALYPKSKMYDSAVRCMKYLPVDKVQHIHQTFVECNPELQEHWKTDCSSIQAAAYIPCIQACEELKSSSETSILPIIDNLGHVELHALSLHYYKSDNAVNDFDGLLKSIQDNKLQSLTLLRMRSTSMSEQQTTRLMSLLEKMPSLSFLDISDNKVEPGRSIPMFVSKLNQCKQLKNLTLLGMRIPARDMALLARNLPSHLTWLDINGNEMDNTVAHWLVSTLPKTLIYLDLDCFTLSPIIRIMLFQSIHGRLTRLTNLSVQTSGYWATADLLKLGGNALISCRGLAEVCLSTKQSCPDLLPSYGVQVFMQQAENIKVLHLIGIRLDRESFEKLVCICRRKDVQQLAYVRDLLPPGVQAEELDDFVDLF